MYGDFSRVTFAPERHYAAVLLQQGRVQLDADSNEQASILLHHLRTLAADIMGPWGVPAVDDGFEITLSLGSGNPKPIEDLLVSPGHMYVAGILCENEAEGPDGLARHTSYFDQPDAWFDRDEPDHRLPDPPFLVYLRVHERSVTTIEDPSIREVALGDHGPDTATRTRIVWQVLIAPTNQVPGTNKKLTDLTLDEIKAGWVGWQRSAEGNRPKLRARAKQPSDGGTDPCIIAPESQYRGPENQLYRVEIHSGGTTGQATFKWSRDNGSVAVPIRDIHDRVITVAHLGRDDRLTFGPDDLVEIVDDRYAVDLRSEKLAQIKSIEPLDLTIELYDNAPADVGHALHLHPLLRRWDHRGGTLIANNALAVAENAWITLEDGVEIQFAPGGNYRTGDHWLVPARTTTGDVEWPRSPTPPHDPVFRRPSGLTLHTAPLAIVGGTTVDKLNDLRSPR